MATDFTEHILVPKHEVVKDKKKVLESYSASIEDFPKILITDPGLAGLSAQEGDLIKISRSSTTAGDATFYRVVVTE